MNSIFHQEQLAEVASRVFPYPQGRFDGRGVVICAGGLVYFLNAWVCINMLRRFGCSLPVELWHLGPEEMSPFMSHLVESLDVTTVDAHLVRQVHPARILNGWELKPYAILHSRFREVLSLDADNVPVRDPTYLFDLDEFQETGAIFWPDFGRLEPTRAIWHICGVPYRDEPEVESGQIVVDKQKSWRALNIAMHLNEHSDYYYQHVHGDKETFHMGWRIARQEYAMPTRGIDPLDGVMCQHDFNGVRVFQHRNLHKWQVSDNARIHGFLYEDDCLEVIETLKPSWHRLMGRPDATVAEHEAMNGVEQQQTFVYCRVGYDYRFIELLPHGIVGRGSAGCERHWYIECADDIKWLVLSDGTRPTCRLSRDENGVWSGQWLRDECMRVLLVPMRI